MTEFDEIYNKYKFYLLKIIKRYIRDLDIAEDLLQDTFIKIWKNHGSFRHESEYKTWITRIAINTCLTYLQSTLYARSKIDYSFDELPQGLSLPHPNYQSPETILSDQQDLDFASNKITKLSKAMKDTLNLFVFGGLCYNDIATKLNTTKFTVRSRLNKARWLIKP